MLYLIKTKEYFKIGYTFDFKTLFTRMMSYKTHNPEFELLGIKEGSLDDEKNYHNKLEKYRIKGNEWFKNKDNILDSIINNFEKTEIPNIKEIYSNKTKKFIEKLLNFSESNDYKIALTEWELLNIDYSDNSSKCICGNIIHKLVIIKNKINNITLTIGSDCFQNHFEIGINDKYYSYIKNKNNLIKEAIQIVGKEFRLDYCSLFYQHNLLSDWEYQFIGDLLNSSFDISFKQIVIFKRICNDIKNKLYKPNSSKLSVNLDVYEWNIKQDIRKINYDFNTNI